MPEHGLVRVEHVAAVRINEVGPGGIGCERIDRPDEVAPVGEVGVESEGAVGVLDQDRGVSGLAETL